MVWMYLYFWCQNLNIFLSKIWKHLIWNFEIIPIAALWTFALIFFLTSYIHLLIADDIIANIAKIDVANRIHLFENWICWNKISLPWISQSRDSKKKVQFELPLKYLVWLLAFCFSLTEFLRKRLVLFHKQLLLAKNQMVFFIWRSANTRCHLVPPSWWVLKYGDDLW